MKMPKIDLSKEEKENLAEEIRQFKYLNWDCEGSDDYGTWEECLSTFEQAVKEDSDIRCSIYDVSYVKLKNGTEYNFDEGVLYSPWYDKY